MWYNKFFPPQMQILLGYPLQIFLLTTSEVFVTSNLNGELRNNLEVVSQFAIKFMMFCVFWHKTTSSEIWRNLQKDKKLN